MSQNINEIALQEIDPKDVNTSNLDVKNELNPKIWDKGAKLKPQIRVALLKIIQKYIEFLDLNDIELKDIVLTGSLANKNYTDASDLDIHLIVDYDDIDKNKDLLLDYFKDKKNLWADKYDLTIYGYPVELFVQDTNQAKDWTAIYSVLNDKWIQQPDLKKITPENKEEIKNKVVEIVDQIESLENEYKNGGDHAVILKKVDELKENISKLREKGLPNGGEMSTENLIFKVLRTGKFLDRLDDLKTDIINKDLTLK